MDGQEWNTWDEARIKSAGVVERELEFLQLVADSLFSRARPTACLVLLWARRSARAVEVFLEQTLCVSV